MEFLVSMTTHVPLGTPEQEVDEIRTREAARSQELASGGHLLRLWQPPVEPGEWRTLGLFAHHDQEQLERDLASMPLRIWRQDDPTPLLPHPNDPGPSRTRVRGEWAEYLTTFTLDVPTGTDPAEVREVQRREAERIRELGEQGYLARLWRLNRHSVALGLWRTPSPDDLEEILDSLPLAEWLDIETMPLSNHPNDPLSHGT